MSTPVFATYHLLYYTFTLKAAGALQRDPRPRRKAASSNCLTSAFVSRVANHFFPFPVGLNVSSKQGSQKVAHHRAAIKCRAHAQTHAPQKKKKTHNHILGNVREMEARS